MTKTMRYELQRAILFLRHALRSAEALPDTDIAELVRSSIDAAAQSMARIESDLKARASLPRRSRQGGCQC